MKTFLASKGKAKANEALTAARVLSLIWPWKYSAAHK